MIWEYTNRIWSGNFQLDPDYPFCAEEERHSFFKDVADSEIKFVEASTVEIRGGDSRNIVALERMDPLENGTNLNSIFGRFVRFLQFRINLGNASLSPITLNLTGNAPNIEKIKFEDENKFTVLQRLAECYQCYLFEDRFGTLRMEHKETGEDWEETLSYLKFTSMRVEGIILLNVSSWISAKVYLAHR